tara:strand:+ start:154 stop:912 length:759 start_codon:yes stop_codon:yes gene_type:complete
MKKTFLGFNHYKHRLLQKISRKFANRTITKIRGLSQNDFEILSPDWLTRTELKYGGLSTKSFDKVSPLLSGQERKFWTDLNITGGDKMIHMGYAPYYSKFFKKFLLRRNEKLNIAEFGIFKGVGLSILSDCFPFANLFGFDINTENFMENKDFLVKEGAFKNNEIYLYTCDQLAITSSWLNSKVKDTKFDIVIDDGFHSLESIEKTAISLKKHLKKGSIYFVEDNSFAAQSLKDIFNDSEVFDYGAIQVVVI